ncbi:MAG TPA: DUF1476 domain-containing protein [Caulobacteraceae bacterium]|jgi:hypothetical protein|nr:DUF1476 domain-containing protein [Caulobacteraceae bacterium]
MTTFDEREQAFEANFAHGEEIEFKAQARRDRLLGLWAGERMGLAGDALQDYALSVMRADLKEPGDDDVLQKVLADLAGKNVECLPHELRARMDELLTQARADLKAGK